ncbi:MAG TPA: shikimate dehydrogenase [Cytophagaceae bacterium]
MRLFGLIGYPLTHSFSKKYFTEKFQKESISDAAYELFEIKEAGEVTEVLKNNPSLCGLNVTIPHKEAVIPYLDEVHDSVKKIKAVNVIKVGEGGKLTGYNSDFFGFRQSLLNFIPSTSLKALVLGTGGAAKAVFAALEDLNIDYLIVSRNKGSKEGKETISYQDITSEIITSHQLIINTTPLGMYPKVDTCPDIPYECLTGNHYLFDLVYNPEETLFMKKGAERGARTKHGLEMLYLQAEKAWEIWTDKAEF